MGAPAYLQTNGVNPKKRVGVYYLNDDYNGEWENLGIGNVHVDYFENSEEIGLYVLDDEENDVILSHRFSREDIYQKQDDKLILWDDIALSFEDVADCSYIWNKICSVRRDMFITPNSKYILFLFQSFTVLDFQNMAADNKISEMRELPIVELLKVLTMMLNFSCCVVFLYYA
ncbi:hypothetical protein ACFE04_006492 [Oxalis oulophora]